MDIPLTNELVFEAIRLMKEKTSSVEALQPKIEEAVGMAIEMLSLTKTALESEIDNKEQKRIQADDFVTHISAEDFRYKAKRSGYFAGQKREGGELFIYMASKDEEPLDRFFINTEIQDMVSTANRYDTDIDREQDDDGNEIKYHIYSVKFLFEKKD